MPAHPRYPVSVRLLVLGGLTGIVTSVAWVIFSAFVGDPTNIAGPIGLVVGSIIALGVGTTVAHEFTAKYERKRHSWLKAQAAPGNTV